LQIEAQKEFLSLNFIVTTGGTLTETLDPEVINKYFIGNLAKQWAISNGYLSPYLGYENDVIR
jgi:hypothetical protein